MPLQSGSEPRKAVMVLTLSSITWPCSTSSALARMYLQTLRLESIPLRRTQVEPRLTTSSTYSVFTRICSRISDDSFIRGNMLMSVLDNCSGATAAVSQVVNRQNLIP